MGRFELLNIRANITEPEVNYTRIALKKCTAEATDVNGMKEGQELEEKDLFFCPPSDLNMTIFGDYQSPNISYWVLQYLPCRSFDEVEAIYNEEQKSEWYSNR